MLDIMINPAWIVIKDQNRIKGCTIGAYLVKPLRGDWRATRACTCSPRRTETVGVGEIHATTNLGCFSASPSSAPRAQFRREQVPPFLCPLLDPARDSRAIKFLVSVSTWLLARTSSFSPTLCSPSTSSVCVHNFVFSGALQLRFARLHCEHAPNLYDYTKQGQSSNSMATPLAVVPSLGIIWYQLFNCVVIHILV